MSKFKPGDQVILRYVGDPLPEWDYQEDDFTQENRRAELNELFSVGTVFTIDEVYQDGSIDWYYTRSDGEWEPSYSYAPERFDLYNEFAEEVRKATAS